MDIKSENATFPPERSEQETESAVASIIESAVMEPNPPKIPTLITLNYGSKELDLFYNAERSRFRTAVQGYEDRERKPEETRLLYLAARKLMQEIANRRQGEVEYALETVDEKMIQFAQGHGRRIFDWDTGEEKEFRTKKGDIYKKWVFQKTLRPDLS
ncbi:MAG: hypothetical protein AAB390_03450 [Patescibacteria group bacterium]